MKVIKWLDYIDGENYYLLSYDRDTEYFGDTKYLIGVSELLFDGNEDFIDKKRSSCMSIESIVNMIKYYPNNKFYKNFYQALSKSKFGALL